MTQACIRVQFGQDKHSLLSYEFVTDFWKQTEHSCYALKHPMSYSSNEQKYTINVKQLTLKGQQQGNIIPLGPVVQRIVSLKKSLLKALVVKAFWNT